MGHKLCIFASGTGSNAQKIIDYFRDRDDVTVDLIVTNKSTAGVLQIAQNENIPHKILEKGELQSSTFITFLQERQTTFIILAGFLKLIPSQLTQAFPQRIINIHPALLPKYGGKGMYGRHVHQAVKDNAEKQSGITIHYVNERYDEGEHIFQASFDVFPDDSPQDIANKGRVLEHGYFAMVIDGLLESYKKQ